MGTTWIDKEVRQSALEMVALGHPTKAVADKYRLHRSTLNSWIKRARENARGYIPSKPIPPKDDDRTILVSEVRRICDLLDEGLSAYHIAPLVGRSKYAIYQIRNNPRYRDATYEYDDAFTYDHTDLLDRAVVAHMLCAEATRGERMDLLMAVVGDRVQIDAPEKRGYGRQIKEGVN